MSIRLLLEPLLIFVVSIGVLFVIHLIANTNTGKATGVGWVHWKGYVLMGVGALYLLFGTILTRVGK